MRLRDGSIAQGAVQILPILPSADVLIVFGKGISPGGDSICTAGVRDTSVCKLKAKFTVSCGEGIEGGLRCGLGTDCNLTFSSLQKNKLQIWFFILSDALTAIFASRSSSPPAAASETLMRCLRLLQ